MLGIFVFYRGCVLVEVVRVGEVVGFFFRL